MEKLKETIQKIFEIAINAPELNMANYDENQVIDLNNAMIEIYNLAEGVLTSKDASALPIPNVSKYACEHTFEVSNDGEVKYCTKCNYRE